jgi:hypothetical protein
MANIRIGSHSNDWPKLASAFQWWLGLPEAYPRVEFPSNLNELLLECARQRGADLTYVSESYGYIIDCANDAGWFTLRSVAGKAGVSLAAVA